MENLRITVPLQRADRADGSIARRSAESTKLGRRQRLAGSQGTSVRISLMRERISHDPGSPDQGQIQSALGPVPMAGGVRQEHGPIRQQAEGRNHGGQQNRGKPGLYASQSRKAGRDEADAGYVTPEHLPGRQPLWDQGGGQVHINKMRSAPNQRTNPE